MGHPVYSLYLKVHWFASLGKRTTIIQAEIHADNVIKGKHKSLKINSKLNWLQHLNLVKHNRVTLAWMPGRIFTYPYIRWHQDAENCEPLWSYKSSLILALYAIICTKFRKRLVVPMWCIGNDKIMTQLLFYFFFCDRVDGLGIGWVGLV